MFTYNQSTGTLWHDGTLVGQGYSGAGNDKNNPERQDVPRHGPIPRGRYLIGDLFDSQLLGPCALRLTALAPNEMYGRTGFLIHGDSLRAPGAGSEGCIVLPRSARVLVGNSSDRSLEVVT